jgi:hypothetical protein
MTKKTKAILLNAAIVVGVALVVISFLALGSC